MNAVAAWAAERSLMDTAGSECVPRRVSLLEAHIGRSGRVADYSVATGTESGSTSPRRSRQPSRRWRTP